MEGGEERAGTIRLQKKGEAACDGRQTGKRGQGGGRRRRERRGRGERDEGQGDG